MSSVRPHFDQNLTTLSERFEWAAEQVFHGASPLYERLAVSAADDLDILALAAYIPASQPGPNLLFGAVHYLLLSGVRHPLGDYFPSVANSPLPMEKAYPHFRSFCLEHAATIIPLLETRRVQTNEVRRCAYLLPAFELVRQREPDRPLALIEIGPSAGLNLLWDKYGYVYNWTLSAGNSASPVRITCEARGDMMPPIPAKIPPVIYRVGVDIAPGDVRDHEAMLWQRAMLWPDQLERAELFWKAVELARADPPRILAGDALDLLPAILAEIPAEATVGIFHSFVLNQFSRDARHALRAMLEAYSIQRALYRVSIEWYSGSDGPQLEFFSYHGDEEYSTRLAACDQHGRWLEWLPGPG